MTLFVWVHYTSQEYLAAEHACFGLENVARELREVRENLGEKSNVLFGFVCGIGGNANTCMREWFSIGFVEGELHPLASYPQLEWMSEGNAFVEKLFDEALKSEEKRITLLYNAAHHGLVGAVRYFLKRCHQKSKL